MKKIISAFLLLILVLCLTTAVFADNYTQNFADLADMAEYVESNGLDINLTEQFFVVDTTASSNYKFELSASEQAVNAFFCVLTRGTGLSEYGLTDNVYLVKKDSPTVTISTDSSNPTTIEPEAVDGNGYVALSSVAARVGLNILTEVTQETTVTLKVYTKTYGGASWEKQKEVTYTLKPDSLASDVPTMAIDCEDRSESVPGVQVNAGDTVKVGFTVPGGFSESVTFTYDSSVFELTNAPEGWTKQDDGSYKNPSAASTVFEFSALAQNDDNVVGTFKAEWGSSGDSVSKSVAVIHKSISYTIKNLTIASEGSKLVSLPYNGAVQSIEVLVTEPASGYTIQYASDDYVQYGIYNWESDAPKLSTVSGTENYTPIAIKISAAGYKDAQENLILFQIVPAEVTITPKDVTLNVGDPLPETFKYTVTGLIGEDELITEPTITCSTDNTNTPGTYDLTPSSADAGDNYTITYATGKLTVKDVWIVKLDDTEYKVEKGDPFTFPSAPTKPGYIFLGWRGADGVTYQPGDEVEITADTSFKAIWANMPDITPGTPDEPDDEPDVDVFPFYDVSVNAWYYDAVKYVWDNGLMNGTGTAEFSPNTTLNRAMVWTILARLDGVDVDGGANWYAKAQEWAVAEGVSDGTDPMGAVTREQLVTMLWRFKGEPTVDFLLTSPDADTISDWAREAMRWAVSNGIIEGDENGCITPTATATRAQAAAIFMRFVEQ